MLDSETAQKIIDLMAKSISLSRKNRFEEALACLDEALEIRPNSLPVHENRGIILNMLARYDEADESFNKILRFVNLPRIELLRHNNLLVALEDCEKTLAAHPGDTKALLRRGDILQNLRRYDDAVHAYDRVINIEGGNKEAFNSRGNALLELNRHEEALECYERALEIAPNNAALIFNRANLLQQLGRLEEAIPEYSRAFLHNPDLAEAVMEQSHCRLAMGHFEIGWRLYESRWQTAQLRGNKLDTPAPLWLGEEELRGKTILLWAEQGFGDAIQFLRYVPLVAQTARNVIVRVPLALKSLTGTLSCPITVLTDEPLPFHHFHCPLMSLPLAIGTKLESIPADVPYLHANTGQTEEWQKRLGPGDKFRIGVVWAGRQTGRLNRTRDMPLEMLRPLAELNIEMVSLQQQVPEPDRKVLDSIPQLRCPGEALTDFADTAALIENLDMLVCTDTAVAHLAGALGKPVWIMLRHAGEWRWLRERSDSPWYPSVRIFRQKVRGDWAGVVREICEQMGEGLAVRGEGRNP